MGQACFYEVRDGHTKVNAHVHGLPGVMYLKAAAVRGSTDTCPGGFETTSLSVIATSTGTRDDGAGSDCIALHSQVEDRAASPGSSAGRGPGGTLSDGSTPLPSLLSEVNQELLESGALILPGKCRVLHTHTLTYLSLAVVLYGQV